jgi:hypothetical protein
MRDKEGTENKDERKREEDIGGKKEGKEDRQTERQKRMVERKKRNIY